MVANEATASDEEQSERERLLTAAQDLQHQWDDCLSVRERTILSKRYGLDGSGPRRRQTLEYIGRELGISKERVRQIQARAERKLREHFDLDRLQDA
jgi:RNA polymerase sigma factor (sigma-70 family)